MNNAFVKIVVGSMMLACPMGWGQEILSQYDVFSRGLRVGRVETIRSRIERDGRAQFRCEVTTDVRVNLLVFRHALHSRDVAYSEHGQLVEFHRDRTENGRTLKVFGALRDGVFRFDIEEDGAPRVQEFRRTDYDSASLDNPEQNLAKPGDSMTLRILSPDGLQIVERRHVLRGEEEISVSGVPHLCQVAELVDTNKTVRRWFTVDELGLCLVRQDGVDKAGRYSLRMKSHGPRQGLVTTR